MRSLTLSLPGLGRLYCERHRALPPVRPFAEILSAAPGRELFVGLAHWRAYLTPASTLRADRFTPLR